MKKIILSVLCLAGIASAATLTTTMQGTCTTYGPTGAVLDTETYPNHCIDLSWPNIQGFGSPGTATFNGGLMVRLGGVITVIPPPYPPDGNSYYQTFGATANLDEWLVVIGGSGSGVIKGFGDSDWDSCCIGPADGANANADILANGISLASSSGPFGGSNFSVPFLFGVPFHVTGSSFIGSSGNPGLGSAGSVESNASAAVISYGIYDSTGTTQLVGAQVVDVDSLPEPATWMLMLCGVLVFLRRQKVRQTPLTSCVSAKS